jgi:hypothetical protein
MEQNPSWETNSCSDCQEISHLLWTQTYHYHVHIILSFDPILSQLNPVKTPISSFFMIGFNIIFPFTVRLGILNGLFPFRFQMKYFNYACIISPICATRLSRLIFIDSTILIVLDEECKFWSSSKCSSLQPLVTFFPFVPNILLSTQYIPGRDADHSPPFSAEIVNE